MPAAFDGPHPAPRERFAFLYAIRGWAILAVMCIHVGQRLDRYLPNAINVITYNGHLGAAVFFMLGMMGLSLSYRSMLATGEPWPVAKLAQRRFAHLAPLFWIMILINLLIYGFAPRYWAPDGIGWPTVFLTMFFMHGWLPDTINSAVEGAWYLSVDAMMLLSLPILLRRSWSAKRLMGISVLAALAGMTINLATYSYFDASIPAKHQAQFLGFLYFWFPNQCCVIVLGAGLLKVLRATARTDRRKDGKADLLLIAVSFSGLFALLSLPARKMAFLPVHYLVALDSMLLMVALARRPIYVMVNPITCHLGRLSYSLFLTHLLVVDLWPRLLYKIHPVMQSHPKVYSGSMLLATFCLSYLVALAAHHFIERPSLRIPGMIARRLQSRRPTAPEPPVASAERAEPDPLLETPFEGDSR